MFTKRQILSTRFIYAFCLRPMNIICDQQSLFILSKSRILQDEIPMMQTSQTIMIKSWGFHVAKEIKIDLNR